MEIPVDHPIQEARHDTLERVKLAESFAQHVLALPAEKGLVVGVFGPWGSGKTSFINLAKAKFNDLDVQVLEFNPWMFSGTEQLVERFFAELSAQLKVRNHEELGKALDEFGSAFTGRIGIWLRIAGTFLRRRSGGLSGHRKKIADALQKCKVPIIVVVDDVDRLSGSETRDVFKLVRLTASFPKIIYIVACDPRTVEKALNSDGIVGRDYLGKIIQVPFELPAIPRQLLKDQTHNSILDTLSRIDDPGPFYEDNWHDVFEEIICPLIVNIRDLRRYCVTIHGTVGGLGGAIACVDMLALEAVRHFLPHVFRSLIAALDDLTVSPGAKQVGKDFQTSFSSLADRSDTDTMPRMPSIDAIIESGKPREAIVKSVILRLFPQGAIYLPGDTSIADVNPADLLQERRVGHELVLRRYLERVADRDLLDAYDAEQAYSRMADRYALEEFLASLDRARLQNVIKHLQHYENEFQPEHAEAGIVVLLNLLPDLPRQSVPLLDESQRLVGAVVVSLLRTLEQGAGREQALEAILSKLTSLFAKITLIERIGHRKKLGRQLVSEDAAARLEAVVTSQIETTPPDVLADERNPVFVVSFAQLPGRKCGQSFTVPDSPKLTFALVQDCQTRSQFGQLGGPSHQRQATGIAWSNLAVVYRYEDLLRQRLSSLMAVSDSLRPWFSKRVSSTEDARILLEHVKQYLEKERHN